MTGERRREEEEEKIMPSLMATLLRWRTHSARTNLVYPDSCLIHCNPSCIHGDVDQPPGLAVICLVLLGHLPLGQLSKDTPSLKNHNLGPSSLLDYPAYLKLLQMLFL